MYLSMIYCSTIGQFIYLGKGSVLGHFNEKAPSSRCYVWVNIGSTVKSCF